jgi:hypothetical protein
MFLIIFCERCSRRVDQPTLFYMPFLDCDLMPYLLYAKWCPSQINHLIILTNRITDKIWKDDCTKAILNYTKEKVIENYDGPYDNIIYNFAWHFFEVHSQMNMLTLFEGMFLYILFLDWFLSSR